MSRARRVARWALYLVLGLCALPLVLLGVLHTDYGREQVRKQVNAALVQVFQGKVVIERLGLVTLTGVRGVDARVYDAQGRQVIRAQGLRAVASLPSLGWQLLTNSDRPELVIDAVHLGYVDVTLREDAEVGVTLASTFLPRKDTAAPPPPSTAPDAGVRLRIRRIQMDAVWAHGRAAGSPDLDAELRHLQASMQQSPVDGFVLDLDGVDLVTRGLPTGADPRGHVSGIVEAPSNDWGPLRLEVALDGQAAGSPLALEASWVGDDVHAQVYLPRVPASFINAQAPGLALDGDVTVAADVDGPLPQLDFRTKIDANAAHVTAEGYAVVSQGMELCASVATSRLDLSRIVPSAPPSQLGARVQLLALEQEEGELLAGYRVDADPGRVAQEQTPAIWLNGRARLEPAEALALAGRLGIAEPGASVNGSYRVRLPETGGSDVSLQLDATLDEPQRLRKLGVVTAGTATVSAELQPERQALKGQASVSLRRMDAAGLQARNVELRAQVAGTSSDPRVHAAATLDLLSGRAHADLDYSARSQELTLFVADLDLPRLAHAFNIDFPLQRGTLGLDACLKRSGNSPHFQLDASAQADLGKVGALKVSARELQLPDHAPTLEQAAALKGELNVNGQVNLEELSPLLVAAGTPVERTTGSLRFELSAKRSERDDGELGVTAFVDTNGLRIIQKREGPPIVETTTEAIAARPFALEGIDLHLAAHASPRGQALATLILRDAGGTLLKSEAELQIAGLWPQRLTDTQAILQAPLSVTLQVPERRLQSLPPLIRPAALRGRVELEASVEGTALSPRAKAHVVAQSLRAAGSKMPIDAVTDVEYAPAGGTVKVDAKLSRVRTAVANALISWQGDLRRVGENATASHGLVASAEAKLSQFPLDVVPDLVDRQITGNVSADVNVKDWGRDARVDVRVGSTSLNVGKIPIQQLDIALRTEQARLVADVGIAAGAGTSRATLDADMSWGARPVPELGHRGSAKLNTKNFELETFSPLLGAYVSELSGVLDGTAQVDVTASSTTVAGSATLQRGVVQVPAVGQRFSDISARLSVGDNQFKLEELQARGTTGRVTARGAARLDGFDLRSAEARVDIRKHEALPLTLEGAAIGDAWGSVNAQFDSPARGERKLTIDVPVFHLVTPEAGGQSLQSLDANEEIHIGVRRADGKFVRLPIQPLEPTAAKDDGDTTPVQPLRVVVKLGRDVTVERGRTAQAQLTGQLTVLSGLQTEVDGRIEVRGGKLDVSGKTFEIERGVVTFEGTDPGNPTITATARWDAPGYSVYAEYLGDVKSGRIKLHAEPPLTQDEIASLLLFGSPDGSLGSSSGNGGNAALAVSVAGDTAAKGLNQVLDDFTNLDVSARVDTTTGSARPELVFQVSPRVSAKVTRAMGAPALGESPDRTFLTLELRLKRSWALSALFGDRGASALDLIWRRRY